MLVGALIAMLGPFRSTLSGLTGPDVVQLPATSQTARLFVAAVSVSAALATLIHERLSS